MVAAPREIALPGYRVTIAPGALGRVGAIARETMPAHRYAIITDEHVGPLYAEEVRHSLGAGRTSTFTVSAGEAFKSRETWSALTDELLTSGFGRDAAIVALGGGVVGDLAGFVAATFMRGIPYLQAPTSLLAMIDASVGGKTGVDTSAGKNLVGAFHQPRAVVADVRVLATLPANHLRAGMAEAIKHGVIADADYFESVNRLVSRLDAWRAGAGDADLEAMLDLVARSVEIKAGIVARDERESGVRKTLNFGHTLGHAIEQCSGYALLHGEAVAIGMAYETLLAERLGIAESGTADRVRAAVRLAGLPERRPAGIGAAEVVVATRTDKKVRAGRVEYALPTRVGAMSEGGEPPAWSHAVSDPDVLAVLA